MTMYKTAGEEAARIILDRRNDWLDYADRGGRELNYEDLRTVITEVVQSTLETENTSLRQQVREAELLVAALVKATGGSVTVLPFHLVTADATAILRTDDPVTGGVRFRIVEK